MYLGNLIFIHFFPHINFCPDFIVFWAVLGSDLVEILKYGFQHGQLSVSQLRDLLFLIFKKAGKGTLGIGGQYLCFVLIIKPAQGSLVPITESFVFCFAQGPDLWCSREIYFFKPESCQRSDRVLQF